MTTRARRGIALPLVLWLIIVLGAVSAGVVTKARAATALASNVRAQLVARNAAESGVTMARAEIEERLSALPDSSGRRGLLNRLDEALANPGENALGDGRFQVTLVDVNARLDVNAATAGQLARLFEFFTNASEAADAAAAIRHWIGADEPSARAEPLVIDPRAGLTLAPGVARPIRSLEEMRRIPGLRDGLLRSAAPYLTVDGDGTVNRMTASDTVLTVAAGELRDEPSRILIVSRGWMNGHPLTHEIQAVYAVSREELALVHWRERGR
jgi:general secretion pathway protein K